MTSFVATVVQPGVSPSESDASIPALKKSGSSPICDQDPPSRSSRRGSSRNKLCWRTEEEHLTQSVDQKQAEVIRKIQSIRGGIGNGRIPTVSSFCAEFEGVLEFVEMEVDEIEEELRRHFPHYLRRRGGSEVCARSSFVASVRPPFDGNHNYCRAFEPSESTTRTAVHREGARGTPGVTPDTRWCAVCRHSGDSELCERLIYLGREISDTHSSDGNQAIATCWAHANCLLWLPDVECHCDWRGMMLHGVAESVAAVNVGESLCCACGRSWASLRCRFAAGGSECRRVYHFPCAVESGCALGPSALVLCDEHARFMPPTGRVKRFAQTVPIFVDGAANYWSLLSSLSSSSWNSSLTFACGSFEVRVRDNGLQLTRWFWSGSAPTEAVPYRIVIRLTSTFEAPNAAPVASGVLFPADFFFNHTGKNEECSDLSVRMKSLQALMAVRSSGWLPDHSMSIFFGGRIYVASEDDGFAKPVPPAVGRRPSGSVLLVFTGGMTPDKLSHIMQDGVFEKLGLSAWKTRLCLSAAAKFFARNRAARRVRSNTDALAASTAAAAAADYDGNDEVRISQLDGAFDQPQQYVSASGGGGVGEVAQVVHFTPAAQVSSAPFASLVANQVLLLDLAGCSNVTSSLMQRKAELFRWHKTASSYRWSPFVTLFFFRLHSEPALLVMEVIDILASWMFRIYMPPEAGSCWWEETGVSLAMNGLNGVKRLRSQLSSPTTLCGHPLISCRLLALYSWPNSKLMF